ncbi:uncharacterized protein LOC124912677 [Impatiens glandulifera]|uniref:uncharacterized protein LOC124912677 n=1 Tax=Impatiens glandulifera TaxID=253017 RepID=UPI001FB1066C|nr:uncharacterized protein LOC124912677 [Impatiens glandulifera]
MGLRFKDFPSILLQGRDAQTMHYTLKMVSFSRIAKSPSILKYTSVNFKVEDYSWRLHIYPNGNKKKEGEGHISIYIELMDTSSLPIGWRVTALVNLFVFDQIRDKYYTVPDYSGVRFSALKLKWGIPRFVELEVFNDSSNGYLVDDECVFGAEVFIIKQPTNKVNVLSLSGEGANHLTRTYVWKIRSLSSLSLEKYDSDKFSCGDFKWWIMLYPKGIGEGKGNSISVYLCLDKLTLPLDTKIFVNFIIRLGNIDKPDIIKSEIDINQHFDASSLNWGFRKSFAELTDAKNKFSMDEACVIQAEVTIVGVVTTKQYFYNTFNKSMT